MGRYRSGNDPSSLTAKIKEKFRNLALHARIYGANIVRVCPKMKKYIPLIFDSIEGFIP